MLLLCKHTAWHSAGCSNLLQLTYVKSLHSRASKL